MGRTPQSEDRFIGLISGTSMDGIDAVLVSFEERRCHVHSAECIPYPAELTESLQSAIEDPSAVDPARLGALDAAVASAFADAALRLANQNDSSPLLAIGSHGQTLYHAPPNDGGFSIQIGDPARVAALTGITTVGGFRNADMALGGEGAPLASGFHAWLFGDQTSASVVLNLGGIANITRLTAAGAELGFDTGPANTLLDLWYARHNAGVIDDRGQWASSGTVNPELLEVLLEDDYFANPPPKSTGREYFNAGWLDARLATLDKLPPPDVQATLAELTAATVADAIAATGPAELVAVCGGGARNHDLLGRMRRRLAPAEVTPSDELGMPADWMEACAFAWLARERLAERCSNAPSVTGASSGIPLGGVFLPPGR